MALTLDLPTGKTLTPLRDRHKYPVQRLWDYLGAGKPLPSMASKPRRLPISKRAWQRNAALVLTLYEGHQRSII